MGTSKFLLTEKTPYTSVLAEFFGVLAHRLSFQLIQDNQPFDHILVKGSIYNIFDIEHSF